MFTNLRLAGPTAEPAACEMSKQRLLTRFGGAGHEFIHGWMGAVRTRGAPLSLPLPPTPPHPDSPGSRHLWRHSTQNHNNSISNSEQSLPASPLHLLLLPGLWTHRASEPAGPPEPQTGATAASSASPHAACQCKAGEVRESAALRVLREVCWEALSSGTFYTCSSQPERLHPPPTARVRLTAAAQQSAGGDVEKGEGKCSVPADRFLSRSLTPSVSQYFSSVLSTWLFISPTLSNTLTLGLTNDWWTFLKRLLESCK